MTSSLKRRTFLQLLAAGGSCLALGELARGKDDKVSPTTVTYKEVGDCSIKADVYGASSDKPRPVVIWIHGGALIMGNREGMDPVLRGKVLKAGYAFVSIDYRLAPETKLPAILEDIDDACRWVRERFAKKEKIAVMGGSAGGYLTLTTGYRVQPRPSALVALWGYGDVTGPWYSRPDPFYRRQPLVSREEAYAAVGGPVLADSRGKNQRGRFYLYCRQQGLWPKEVAGLDPAKESKAFDPYCPVRNVTATYPPTLLIHGTKDTDVPYELSADMARELDRKGVEHQLITVPDGGHGLPGVKPAVITRIHEQVLTFLDKHLR
jgi:acetyl esterase/lipase